MSLSDPLPVDDAEVRLAEREVAAAHEAFRVTLDRSLAERLLAGLRAAETPAGHLAQRVTHERLGYCGWRQESSRCIEHRALVAALAAALETEG